MNKKLAIMPGDGIGPEVIEQAIKVLDAICERFDHTFLYCYADIGAVAIDRHGTPLPDETLETLFNADAILFGALGHPKYDNDPNAKVRPEQGLLRMRKELGLFCNVRPVTTFPKLLHLSPLKESVVKDVSFTIYRELTGGIYFGERSTNEDKTYAYDKCEYSVAEIERISHLAFQAAQKRRKLLTLVDKANVLDTSRLWRATVDKLAPQYPDVKLEKMFVDNAAMKIISNPTYFDVILTSNLFGDILSDEASVLAGSLGMLPSASIGAKHALFEPIHGSFPEAAGQDSANPMATILSAAMMLDHLGMRKEGATVRAAIYACLEQDIGTPDLNTGTQYSCSKVGDIISTLILDEKTGFKKGTVSEGISTII